MIISHYSRPALRHLLPPQPHSVAGQKGFKEHCTMMPSPKEKSQPKHFHLQVLENIRRGLPFSDTQGQSPCRCSRDPRSHRSPLQVTAAHPGLVAWTCPNCNQGARCNHSQKSGENQAFGGEGGVSLPTGRLVG